ncbi:hypothetical protein [Metabacillus niabensis]|uniref:Uncharacterized protein n=1 Tax=Metabacillus niabensis TaxID=324854 RepID=A0ABT9Z275_9BACI|nr:hypothetical protein [Metabacillus niabensis]MDQ0226351.1 hypothetical protein [Metabacillus niabensis]
MYADVHNENIKKEELDNIIDNAIIEVNNFYREKDKIIAGELTLPHNVQEIESEGQNPIYLWIVSAILALFVINFLMKLLIRRKKQ